MAHTEATPAESASAERAPAKASRIETDGRTRGMPARLDDLPLSRALPSESYLAAIIAHEISNPFTALMGRIDLMRSRKEFNAAMSRELDSMKNAASRIDKILTNLKTFSRRGHALPQTLALPSILDASVARFEDVHGQRGIHISVECPAVNVLANAELLVPVIAAVMETLCFRQAGLTRLAIGVEVHALDEEVGILFEDEGPPIGDEESARVFHPFGGREPSSWPGTYTLAYAYYIIRAWGGTFRFRQTESTSITEMMLALQP